ncbi:MAG: hypothetical protein M1515_04475 [Candidatus Thermoplasmatota archaeon]|jgi:hypothetical protein|nr:hypothetical protein [Candidatus Thermoplasmatota archaeon]
MMDSNNRRIWEITSIFVALEAVFIYYVVGLLLVGYRPGSVLFGFKPAGSGLVLIVYNNPLKYFLGLSYVLKTFFPTYWYHVYHFNPTYVNAVAVESQIKAANNFMFAVWLGLIVAAIIVAVVYAIKLRANLKATPKTPMPVLEVSC